jgi:hypothetical protein
VCSYKVDAVEAPTDARNCYFFETVNREAEYPGQRVEFRILRANKSAQQKSLVRIAKSHMYRADCKATAREVNAEGESNSILLSLGETSTAEECPQNPLEKPLVDANSVDQQ